MSIGLVSYVKRDQSEERRVTVMKVCASLQPPCRISKDHAEEHRPDDEAPSGKATAPAAITAAPAARTTNLAAKVGPKHQRRTGPETRARSAGCEFNSAREASAPVIPQRRPWQCTSVAWAEITGARAAASSAL
jgi:hypothetical protein